LDALRARGGLAAYRPLRRGADSAATILMTVRSEMWSSALHLNVETGKCEPGYATLARWKVLAGSPSRAPAGAAQTSFPCFGVTRLCHL
jgi:hypothetical protein